MRKAFLVLAVLAFCLSFAFANVTQGQEAKSKDFVLMHDKAGNPAIKKGFEDLGAALKKDIGMGFTPTVFGDSETHTATVRSALPTSNAPEFFTWWTGERTLELYKLGLLADITDVWDKHKDEYDNGLRQIFTYDGKVYGMSQNLNYWVVFYKKDLFKKLKISVPKTWNDFIKVCDVIKKAGKTPLWLSTPYRFVTMIMFEELMIGQDAALYEDLCKGKVKYSDPRVKAVFKLWADMIKKGYFSDPAVSIATDLPPMMAKNEIAMAVVGTWYYGEILQKGVKQEDLGLFILPRQSGKKTVIVETGPILLSAKSPNLSNAKKVLDAMMGPKYSKMFCKAVTAIPTNKKVDTSFLPTELKNVQKKVVHENYGLVNRYLENTPVQFNETALDIFAKFMANPDAIDPILAELDKAQSDFYSKK